MPVMTKAERRAARIKFDSKVVRLVRLNPHKDALQRNKAYLKVRVRKNVDWSWRPKKPTAQLSFIPRLTRLV